jgi:hypothetical protein
VPFQPVGTSPLKPKTGLNGAPLHAWRGHASLRSAGRTKASAPTQTQLVSSFGGWPSFALRLNWQAIGCPTFRDFRKVGATDLDPNLHSSQPTAGLVVLAPDPCPSGSIIITGRILSLHHHQLLPAPAIARQPTKSESASPRVEHVLRSVTFPQSNSRSM